MRSFFVVLLLAALTLPAQTPPLDVNTATASQLAALPGMGPVYAARVLKGRPYTAKNQLVTRGILPRETYDRIKDSIIAHRPVRRVTFPTLGLHSFGCGKSIVCA